MDSTLKRTWAEIDLDALVHNYHMLRKKIGPEVKFLGVVKADAYGHGSVPGKPPAAGTWRRLPCREQY